MTSKTTPRYRWESTGDTYDLVDPDGTPLGRVMPAEEDGERVAWEWEVWSLWTKAAAYGSVPGGSQSSEERAREALCAAIVAAARHMASEVEALAWRGPL